MKDTKIQDIEDMLNGKRYLRDEEMVQYLYEDARDLIAEVKKLKAVLKARSNLTEVIHKLEDDGWHWHYAEFNEGPFRTRTKAEDSFSSWVMEY